MKLIRWYSKLRTTNASSLTSTFGVLREVFSGSLFQLKTLTAPIMGGVHFMVGLCNLQVEFNSYEIRHWNEAAGRYNLEGEYDA
jgi:hypothetical protein